MAAQLARAIGIITVLLLGIVVGAWLSLAAMYMAFEPTERTASNALLVAVLVALLAGLTFAARKLSGTQGFVAFVSIVLLGALATGWLIL